MAKSFDEAIDKVLDRYEEILIKGMEVATRVVRKDVHKYALKCLEQYYANYPQFGGEDEMSYHRTHQLQNAIGPTSSKVKTNGKEAKVSVGVAYDPSALDGVYDGSKKYGHPEGSWVLDNYLKGIHPTTNGASNPALVEYIKIYDSDIGDKSPWEKMENYLDTQVREKFTSYLLGYFMKQIAK